MISDDMGRGAPPPTVEEKIARWMVTFVLAMVLILYLAIVVDMKKACAADGGVLVVGVPTMQCVEPRR